MNLLDTAEQLDGYRTACAKNPYNAAARKGQIYELDTVSPTAIFYLRGAIEATPLAKGSEFVILSPTADQGMPHTRPPNLICLPTGLCREAPASPQLLTTLRHEAIHIHQRAHPDAWRQALERIGWTPLPADTIPAEFRERARINPDTMASPFWAWKRYHVPLPLFKRDTEPSSLHDCTVQWMDLRSGALFRDPPSSFTQVYGSSIHQPEHPYEIYAELLSERKDLMSQAAIGQVLQTL